MKTTQLESIMSTSNTDASSSMISPTVPPTPELVGKFVDLLVRLDYFPKNGKYLNIDLLKKDLCDLLVGVGPFDWEEEGLQWPIGKLEVKVWSMISTTYEEDEFFPDHFADFMSGQVRTVEESEGEDE